MKPVDLLLQKWCCWCRCYFTTSFFTCYHLIRPATSSPSEEQEMVPGVALRPQLSPATAAGLSPLRGLSRAALGRKPRKISAWFLVYRRDVQIEVSLIYMVFRRPQVIIITVVMNRTFIMCQHYPGHCAWVISFHSTQSFKIWVTVLSLKSRKQDIADMNRGRTTVKRTEHSLQASHQPFAVSPHWSLSPPAWGSLTS